VKATNEHIDPYELLVKYITGEANADEKLEVEQWIDANAENRQYYAHFKLIWDESRSLANDNEIDEDKAWGRFRERIQNEYVAATKPRNSYVWLKAAAVVLFVSAAVVFGTRFFAHKNTTRYAAKYHATAPAKSAPLSVLRSVATNRVKVDSLPDGSVITQKKNSSVSFTAGATRNVELTGEAFFNVKHDANKPFIIKVNDVLITVLGTSFNVKSTNKTTEVFVVTGLVSVTRRQHTVALRPGEKLTTVETAAIFKTEHVKDHKYTDKLDGQTADRVIKLPDKKDAVLDDKKQGKVKTNDNPPK
jgi:transmembrane sensor